jgi:hypothetical protein
MHSQQNSPIGVALLLPVLLIVALAAWTATFLTGRDATAQH